MQHRTLSDREFGHFQRFIFDAAGITLSPAKKALVCGRLAKRLHATRLANYADYFALLQSGTDPVEVQMAIDLLTTNETYFFREARHFELLRTAAMEHGPTPFRVWSAASSSGEEAYSIAMVLADCRAGQPYDIVGTDISSRMVEKARTGHYPEPRARQIPQPYLRRFCLKGQGPQAGTMLVARELRQKVRFLHANLNTRLPDLGCFDVVFLRNVMIYFNGDTKREVVSRVVSHIRPGGYLYIGHSESLHGIHATMEQLAPSVYRKP